MDAPRELPQHTAQQSTGTPQLTSPQPPEIRRATAADAAALQSLAPTIAAPDGSETRVVFVIDNALSIAAAMELVQAAKWIEIEHLVAAPHAEEHRRALIALAEQAARALGARDLHLRPGIVPDEVAAALGFRRGIKRTREVPLWKLGSAPLPQAIYYRGVWAALALIVGMGSVSVAVFGTGDITLAHILVPAGLCIASILFATWQIWLVALAAIHDGRRWIAAATCGAALAAVVMIGLLAQDRAVPALAELWAIRGGDQALGDLAITLSDDGRTMRIDGSYGLGGEQAVLAALSRHREVREVVLSGPGGRIGVGYALYDLFRKRRLATRVETGCASACTIAFLGGTERSISATGKLGFHQTSFPGMSENDMYETNRAVRRFLTRAGVTPAFAERVIQTPPDAIWIPTTDELLAGRVVNKVSP